MIGPGWDAEVRYRQGLDVGRPRPIRPKRRRVPMAVGVLTRWLRIPLAVNALSPAIQKGES